MNKVIFLSCAIFMNLTFQFEFGGQWYIQSIIFNFLISLFKSCSWHYKYEFVSWHFVFFLPQNWFYQLFFLKIYFANFSFLKIDFANFQIFQLHLSVENPCSGETKRIHLKPFTCFTPSNANPHTWTCALDFGSHSLQ